MVRRVAYAVLYGFFIVGGSSSGLFCVFKKKHPSVHFCLFNAAVFYLISLCPFSVDLSEMRSYSIAHGGNELFSSLRPAEIENAFQEKQKMYIKFWGRADRLIYQEEYYCRFHLESCELEVLISREHPERNYIKKGWIYYTPGDPDFWLEILQTLGTGEDESVYGSAYSGHAEGSRRGGTTEAF